MSWAKVKKINSDFDVPLDTLLNSKVLGTTYTNKTPTTSYGTTTDANWTTVVEVTGSGLAIVGFNGAILTARITVDGVVLDETPADTNFANTTTRVYGSTSLFPLNAIVENYGCIYNRNNDNANPNPPPIPLEANIGFETSFKFEIRRNTAGTTNVSGMAVVFA